MSAEQVNERDRVIKLIEALRLDRRGPQSKRPNGLPRYLVASDLHGNNHRLAELLAVAAREQVDHIFLVGDLYSGRGGWGVFRRLQQLAGEEPEMTIASPPATHHAVSPTTFTPADRDGRKMTLMWGNHEVALVSGMLGNDRQLRFFYNFGGEHVLAEAEAERRDQGLPPIQLSGGPRLTADDLAAIRQHEGLQELCRWIQRTHRLFAVDSYGTGYVHAFPKIDRHGSLMFHYNGIQGLDCVRQLEFDLSQATRSDDRVFSPLLQTETSPVWALYEIQTARQFDQALRPHGVRQVIFGHRHHTTAVNVRNCNRQIGIAVDFDQGRGGYLLIDSRGLAWHQFVDLDTHRVERRELIASAGQWTADETHYHELEEFLFSRLVTIEQQRFSQWSAHSVQAKREFEFLESVQARGFQGIHRLYAELYTHVKNAEVSREMLAAAVASGDEDAFRSFIHLLFHQLSTLEGLGTDWYQPAYQKAKGITTVVLNVLRDMPLARLGLLDIRMRGTTSRFNLHQLYHRLLQLQDPDLALLAVQNLGTLQTTDSAVQLREAFFHDARRVRVRAAEILAGQGETAYPWVAPLLRSTDGWVRGLAMWTVAEIGRTGSARGQAIRDLRRVLDGESDWFLSMLAQELLRKLGSPKEDCGDHEPEIPNVTNAVVEILQEIVDSQKEPFRRAFKVFFITIELSSPVYRRGLIGMDLDDLKVYVNNADYFPPYYRYYKAGDRDIDGRWRGWRRLWLRGETPNRLDGPQIIEIESDSPPELGPRTIVLYDHRWPEDRVTLPPFDQIVAEHGYGKIKDRTRHALLARWGEFSVEDRRLIARIHAAALVKMLFQLPAELWVSATDRERLAALADMIILAEDERPRRILKLVQQDSQLVIQPLWIDALKYPVEVKTIPTEARGT